MSGRVPWWRRPSPQPESTPPSSHRGYEKPLAGSTVPTAVLAPATLPTLALAGAPNVGKSTLFNALTGARHTMGNWPGTTVEVGQGTWRCEAEPTPHLSRIEAAETGPAAYRLVDLPGAYSLDPISPDEELTRAVVLGTPGDGGDTPSGEGPDLVVVVVDAAHLARSLYLVSQLREEPVRAVVALTMVDVAASRGIHVDTAALGAQIGVPVVAVDPRRRTGLGVLAAAVRTALAGPPPPTRPHRGEGAAGAGAGHSCRDELACADERYSWIEQVTCGAVTHEPQSRLNWTDRLDRIALSRLGGPALFALVMWLVFQPTTMIAAPLQEGLDGFFSGPVSDGALAALGAVGLDHPVVTGFLVNGLIAGVGMVLTFVPLMAIMFVLLALLEQSGYMARAAVVADRSMRRLGLPGRAFLPFIVGFGCNVPAITATRVLPGPRHRLLTALLVPFTSCSARLTVYVMLGTAFFGPYAGTVVFGMYVASILIIVGVGFLLRQTLWRTMGAGPLVLDLPPYQRPTLRVMWSVTWMRLEGFLRTAGGIIVVTVAVVWLLQALPVRGEGSFGSAPVTDSAYAAVSEVAALAFEPAGFATWESSGALLTGFVAKEAVIAAWAQTYAIEEGEAGSSQEHRLGEQIRADFAESSGGHENAAALAFLVFLLASTPCVATLAAQRREIGVAWTIGGVGIQLVVAWTLAVVVFQIGRLFG